METLEEKIHQLSPELQKEVEQFVQLLLKKNQPEKRQKPKLDWTGALREIRGEFTSVELQHEILKERMKQP